MASTFSFPNPVNEKVARVVAAAVALISLVGLLAGWDWLLVLMAAGFWLRVAAGPRFSPLGLIATRLVAPRLGEPTLVPGPPKRFAQMAAETTTSAGALLVFAFWVGEAAPVVFGIMVVFATLESVFALCVGCQIFALLMRFGIIPEEVCEACADIRLRRA